MPYFRFLKLFGIVIALLLTSILISEGYCPALADYRIVLSSPSQRF